MKSMGGGTLWAALLAFAGAVVVLGASAADAVRLRPMVEPSSQVGGQPQTSGVEDQAASEVASGLAPRNNYPKVTNNEILEAVNQDLFQPTRTPSLERYLLPSERIDSFRDPRNDRRLREPDLRVVGTAIAGDLSLAMVQPEDSVPIAVLLGEVIDGYRLAAVTEDYVTLTREDAEFTLPVVEPQRGRSSESGGRTNRERADTEAAAQALTERVQQMLQQMGRAQALRGGMMQFREQPVSIQLTGGQGGEVRDVTIRRRGGADGGGEGELLP